MRILGGQHAGLILKPKMKKWPTRPTTDLAKEALYNILMNRIDFTQATMLDLFGGTGIHTLEFLSRGCTSVDYIDHFGPCVRWIKEVVNQLGYQDYCHIYKSDVKKFIETTGQVYTIIIADPPYHLHWIKKLPDLIFSKNILRHDGLFILEHDKQHSFTEHSAFQEERKYGQTRFTFFTVRE